jgi:hypothetical protein
LYEEFDAFSWLYYVGESEGFRVKDLLNVVVSLELETDPAELVA